jgi:hypothetical protein
MTNVKDFFSISAVLILSGNIGHLYKLVYTNIMVLTMLHQIVWHKNEYTKKCSDSITAMLIWSFMLIIERTPFEKGASLKLSP